MVCNGYCINTVCNVRQCSTLFNALPLSNQKVVVDDAQSNAALGSIVGGHYNLTSKHDSTTEFIICKNKVGHNEKNTASKRIHLPPWNIEVF